VFLIAFLFLFLPGTEPYQVATRSGLVFQCKEKPTISKEGMVEMQLIDGPFLSIPKAEIDWDETRFLNKEIAKRVKKQSHGSATPLQDLAKEFNRMKEQGWNFAALRSSGLIFVLAIILAALLGYLWCSTLFWIILRQLGEPIPYLPWLGWNLLSQILAGLVVLGVALLLGGPLLAFWCGVGAYFLLLIWVLNSLMSVEIQNVLLGNLIYQVLLLLQTHLIGTYLLGLSSVLW
jgi:hypothetical protein